jgi:hypothetical protein
LSRSSGNESDASASARLIKQQFRLKCQQAMAKDRTMDRHRKVAQSRNYRNVTDLDSDEEQQKGKGKARPIFHSDDLSSSEIEESCMDEREIEVSSTLDGRQWKWNLCFLFLTESLWMLSLRWLDAF